LSGPSGSGKSTVLARLLERCRLPLRVSVSATTRAPRPKEKDGVHYHFWTPERFDQEVKAGGFLEWATVHGQRYGTLKREVEVPRERGIGVILDIDVQGAEQIRPIYPEAATIFLRAPSLEADEKRLRKRSTEDEAAIQRRLAGARAELARANEYHYQVINDNLEEAVDCLRKIVEQQFEKGDGNAG